MRLHPPTFRIPPGQGGDQFVGTSLDCGRDVMFLSLSLCASTARSTLIIFSDSRFTSRLGAPLDAGSLICKVQLTAPMLGS